MVVFISILAALAALVAIGLVVRRISTVKPLVREVELPATPPAVFEDIPQPTKQVEVAVVQAFGRDLRKGGTNAGPPTKRPARTQTRGTKQKPKRKASSKRTKPKS